MNIFPHVDINSSYAWADDDSVRWVRKGWHIYEWFGREARNIREYTTIVYFPDFARQFLSKHRGFYDRLDKRKDAYKDSDGDKMVCLYNILDARVRSYSNKKEMEKGYSQYYDLFAVDANFNVVEITESHRAAVELMARRNTLAEYVDSKDMQEVEK